MKIQFNSRDWGDDITASLGSKFDTAVEKTVEYIAIVAKDRCPVKTGEMRDSIVAVMEPDTYVGESVGYVTVDTPYAEYVHDGTVKKGPNPFLRVATEMGEDYLDFLLEQVVKEHLDAL